MRNRVRFENELMAFLEERGYNCLRSAGSRGPADVFAFNTQHCRVIQVKSTKRMDRLGNVRVFAEAIESLRKLPCPPGVTHELWVKPLRQNWRYIVVSDWEVMSNKKQISKAIRQAVWIEA